MAAKRPRTRRGLSAAIGLGLAGGMRTFVPPAALALRDRRPASGLLRLGILLASAGELAADKHPSAPSRTEPAGLGGRFAASGSVGWACAGPIGGLLGGATAIGSALVMHGVRGDLGERTGLPDPVLGALEDSLALSIARFATRKPLPARSRTISASRSQPAAASKSQTIPAARRQPVASQPAAAAPPVAPARSKPAKGRKAAKAAKAASSTLVARW